MGSPPPHLPLPSLQEDRSYDEGEGCGARPSPYNAAKFKAMPNPTTQYVFFDQPIDAQVFDQHGRLVSNLEGATRLQVTSWEPGMYNIVTREHGTRRFVKL